MQATAPQAETEPAESRRLRRRAAGPGRRNFAHTARYKRSEPGHRHMRYWTSQIVIGIIVTVVGTVLANVIIKAFGSRKHVIDGAHYSGPARAGR